MLSEFITTPRTNKQLNVDRIRKELLLNTLDKKGLSDFSAYKQIFESYFNIFGGSKYINIFLVDHFLQKIIKTSKTNVFEDVETNVINYIRPFINACIRHLNKRLSTLHPDAFIVLVGGDAMRRYDINISTTSDFDTKVYVPQQFLRQKRKMAILQNLLVDELSKFVVMLNIFKNEILPSGSKVVNLPELSIEYTINTPEKQFRLRFIEKSKSLPVNLYSIDYRTKIKIVYQRLTIELPFDIPLLDLVTVSNDNYPREKVVNSLLSQVVPVASLDFLLGDLTNTYNNVELASARYWNNKSSKDMFRFRILSDIKSQLQLGSHFRFLQNDNPLNAVYQDDAWNKALYLPQVINEFITYSTNFKTMIDINRKMRKIKHKMKFDGSAPDYQDTPDTQDYIITRSQAKRLSSN